MAFSAVVAYLVFISDAVSVIYYADNLVAYIMLVVTEFFVGFAAGFVVYMTFVVFHFAGQQIDFKIGFAMVTILDPLTAVQVPITGNLLFMLVSMLLVVSGGLNLLIAVFHFSYAVLPIGIAQIANNQTLAVYMVEVMIRFFTIGVSIALPIVGAMMIVDVSLGLLAKAVPQINFFVVGLPIKIMVGTFLFILILPMFGFVYDIVFTDAYRHLLNVIRGMHP